MFDALSARLGAVFTSLRGRGTLSEGDVDVALGEIRRALLEADVALPVARDFIGGIREKAVGREVLGAVSPGQQVVKLVHDELVEALGGAEPGALRLDDPPATVLMVGLQGSGKTTTTAKIARRLAVRDGKRVLMASLDTRRPAAMEQLATLGAAAGIDCLEIVPGEGAVDITRRARESARRGGYDVLFLDTAGRMTVDDELMAESLAIRDAARPRETLLVADALTGQTAVTLARGFHEALGLTGVVLTRLDGDGRGGAALSMRAITGQPILYAGVGEGIEDLEVFRAERIASRIVGMGDVVSLVERVEESMSEEEAEGLKANLAKGKFDMNDFRKELEFTRRIGGMSNIAKMLPRFRGYPVPAEGSDRAVRRQIAIIQSMTKLERRRPEILKGSRRRRIAAGAGVPVSDVNALLIVQQNMLGMARSIGKSGGMSPAQLEKAAAHLVRKAQSGGMRLRKQTRRTRRW